MLAEGQPHAPETIVSALHFHSAKGGEIRERRLGDVAALQCRMVNFECRIHILISQTPHSLFTIQAQRLVHYSPAWVDDRPEAYLTLHIHYSLFTILNSPFKRSRPGLV
jgi:hypothetical protein